MAFDFTKEPGKICLNRNLNTKGTPLLSLITPYYNAGKYLEQTFYSVVSQTFPFFEWIIVDDGSTNEEDISLLMKFSELDNRIQVYRKNNGGIASARNLGVQKSTTDIVVPLDADDLIIPTYLELLYFGLYFNPHASWSYTDCLGFQGQQYLWRKDFSSDVMKRENILVCCAAIRKKDFEEIGFYSECAKQYNEDWFAWLKLLGLGKYPVHIRQYGFWYRRQDNGVLSEVLNNDEIVQQNKKLIAQAAATVKVPVTAKEYPYNSSVNMFRAPIVFHKQQKVFQEHCKIHVMFLIPWLEMGGADLFNLDVVRNLDRSRFEISILTTVRGDGFWRQRFEEYVTDIFELPNFLDVENYAEFVSYFIKSREIDLIFLSNSYYGYYLLPWIRKEFPKVAIVDCIHADLEFWRSGGYTRLSAAVDYVIDETFITNEYTRNIMLNKYGKSKEKTQVIYTGVDEEYFNPDLVSDEGIKARYGIIESRPTVLYLCRIEPEKRPFLMLEIARETRKKIPSIAFLVVGDGRQFKEFQQHIQRYNLSDTVYCAGRQEDIRPYYKACDLSLICSLKEGLSIVTFDSMQMGKPVVSADVGSQYELVNEETGMLIPFRQNEEIDFDSRNFPEEEVLDYVNAIREVLENKPRYLRMSIACQQKIKEGFSTKLMIKTLEKEFKNLVKNPEMIARRDERSDELKRLDSFVNDYLTVFSEVEKHENINKNSYGSDAKNELMRLANSKWGSRIIKLAFKLKLNKMF
ncbi:glycosyltransferase [Desulfosporosinus sp. Sb-LF]|uniref:glycosyltransferase n=1 Tax=Desulfosporosinus sp. Sb-LF TaxID=2560027 RepID=UPI00107FC705|nr:glycosyltransferase [Desulfosporosinus sp. Sb-LF]TGE33795.1 glycosyltransferase [Desulfosporosinus sp. Sb-LF]